MKDWKFIKVGNYATGPNWDKKRQLEDELRGWMTSAQKLTGEEKQNAEKQIAEIRKELNDVKIKIAHGENKKAWNESIEKQEWSMFKGLSKDAEKEVGNTQTYINGEWKDKKSPKEQLIEYAKKSNDPEYLEHVKKMTNPNDINARLQWHKKSGNETIAEYEILKQDPSKMHPLYKKAYEKAMKKLASEDEDFKKRFEKEYGVKSKNGLSRARNAMNKKVKNSSVREYKDSEGRIAQIDFNSDGTDADMSIYEDERMTRSVESKNFSTIRDAEQYVQSHGFRRVG